MSEPATSPAESVSPADLIGGQAPVAPAVVNSAPPADAGGVTFQDAANAPKSPAAPTPWDGERDKLGRAWDAEKFATNPDGSPRRDTLGRFIPRGLGRKPAKAEGGEATGTAAPRSFVAPDAPAPAVVGENATVETIVGVIQMVLILIGDEEGVLSNAEKLLLRPSLERLLKKYEIGADVMPAEVEVLLAVAGIVIERIKRGGKTATAFAKFKAWAAGVFFRAKGMQMGAQVRREVPADLVGGLQGQIDRLKADLAAQRTPAAVTTPSA